MPVIMEENKILIEELVEKVTDYAKTSFELVKLKALDKTADVVSSIVPHSVFIVLISSFIIFLNLGIAFWLGEILGKTYFGFFAVAAFYGVTGIILHFMMHERIKKLVSNYIIKQLLK
jgi:hypothetical protein